MGAYGYASPEEVAQAPPRKVAKVQWVRVNKGYCDHPAGCCRLAPEELGYVEWPDDLFAGAPSLTNAVERGHAVMLMDVKCAFLHGNMLRKVYIELPRQVVAAARVGDLLCAGSAEELEWLFGEFRKKYYLKQRVLEQEAKYLNRVLRRGKGGIVWAHVPKDAGGVIQGLLHGGLSGTGHAPDSGWSGEIGTRRSAPRRSSELLAGELPLSNAWPRHGQTCRLRPGYCSRGWPTQPLAQKIASV